MQADARDEERVYRLAVALYLATEATREKARELAIEADLTEPLLEVIWRLSEPKSMRTLAEELKCDPTNVTFLADRLEQRHLVERQADSDDRRIRRLALTARGRSLRNRLVGAIKNDSPLSKLDNREQRELERLLERLLDDQA